MATYLSSYKLFKREEDLMDIAGEVRMFCWGHQNIDYPLKTLRTAPYKNQLYSYLPLISLGREEQDLMDIAGNVRMFCWGHQN